MQKIEAEWKNKFGSKKKTLWNHFQWQIQKTNEKSFSADQKTAIGRKKRETKTGKKMN